MTKENKFFKDVIDKLLEITGSTNRFENIVGMPNWYNFLTVSDDCLESFRTWYVDRYMSVFGKTEQEGILNFKNFVSRFSLTDKDKIF